jgi:hypothetical protein
MVPEAVLVGESVDVPTGGAFPGFPIHADARTHTSIKAGTTGMKTFFMEVCREIEPLIILVHFRF